MEFVAKYRAVDPDVYITVSIMTREWKKGRIVVKSRKKVVLEPGDGVLSVIGRWAAEKKFVVHDEKYFVRLFKFPSKKKKVKQK